MQGGDATRNLVGARSPAVMRPRSDLPAAVEGMGVAPGQDNIVRLDAAQDARDAFLGWQCRIRQIAMRDHGGRPTPGMRPVLEVAARRVGPITVVLNKRDGGETTQFRFMVKRTHDPLERYEAAMRHLAAAYYQKPASFSDQMTALFAPDASLPGQIAGRGDCVLLFEQFSQRWRLPCCARLLDSDSPAWQATWWHNALFNEHLPGSAQIVAFAPDWARAEADPPPV